MQAIIKEARFDPTRGGGVECGVDSAVYSGCEGAFLCCLLSETHCLLLENRD